VLTEAFYWVDRRNRAFLQALRREFNGQDADQRAGGVSFQRAALPEGGRRREDEGYLPMPVMAKMKELPDR